MIQNTSFFNPIWNSPILLPIPRKSCGHPAVCSLTEGSGGKWRFLFDTPSGIPSPFSANQNYDFSRIAEEKWRAITVPGSLVMQGYDIQNNREYYYRRTVLLPQKAPSGRIFLRFEGIYCNARIWVDGQFVRSHIGGFTPWDCEITSFLNGDSFTLTIGVADIEGKAAGVWNPDSAYVSDVSWASYYAHHNIGGILRDISLFVLPESHFTRIHLHTKLDERYENAVLSADLQLDCRSENLEIELELIRNDEVLSKKAAAVTAQFEDRSPAGKRKFDLKTDGLPQAGRHYENDLLCQKRYIVPQGYSFGGTPHSLRLSMPVKAPRLWDAEHPNLYLVRLTLLQNGTPIEVTDLQTGFREICYGGMRGTDPNKVYVNGKAVKLRGVCRHDVSVSGGRSVPKEEILAEMLAYQRNHVNFIRTSHYPASDYLLTLCDQMGIYVEQENAACFKGANNFGNYAPPEDFINGFAEMVASSRNHPCVLIWSLANESGFEHTAAFRREFEYVKAEDPTRPVIFSYPDTVRTKPLPYDIYSRHYAKVTSGLGRKDMPILHDEFAHVACYNTEQLQRGEGCRAFWGESIQKGWDALFHADGALGCAIWAAVDDVFYLPDGTSQRHQSHSPGKCAGYGEWGCILDAWKREKPEAYLTRKAFTPIRIQKIARRGQSIVLEVENRFDHTNFSEVSVQCHGKNGELLFEPQKAEDLPPHQSGKLQIADPQAEVEKIAFLCGGETVESCTVSTPDVFECRRPPLPFRARMAGRSLLLQQADATAFFRVRFFHTDPKIGEGTLRLLRRRGEEEINCVLLMKRDIRFSLLLRNTDAGVVFRMKPLSAGALWIRDNDLLIEITLPSRAEKIAWNKKSLYAAYPANHIDRPSGSAQRLPADGRAAQGLYGSPPQWGWEQDLADWFLFSDCSATANRDFKCQRDRVRSFCAQMTGQNVLRILSHCENLRAQLDCGKNCDTLVLSKGCRYPDLQWGNACGKRQPLRSRADFQFTVSILEKNNSAERGDAG